MNLQNIQAVANQACFSTNPNIKFETQKVFMDFVFNLHVSHYSQILQKFSQTVLFVFLSYLDKKLAKGEQLIEIFMQLKTHALSWHQSNGQFKRQIDPQYLKSYVSNTLGMVLGKCMKYIFVDEKLRKHLIDYLKQEPNSLFKLFLYKNFIDAVSTIDDKLEFIEYRTLINSVQEKMIPIFIRELYPYFISVTDHMQINELGHMLPSLNDIPTQTHFELFRPQDKNICSLVFSLLRDIVTFKYNITISEFDLETQFQNCMVSFPESILSHLSSKEFLEAFYFMLEKMISSNYGGPQFDISCECLKKILLSKINHLKNEQRMTLTHIHYFGILKLLKANISSEKALNEIFECLFKFVHAFQFKDLEQASINFMDLVQIVKVKSIQTIKCTQISFENRLYRSACNAVFKIATESMEMYKQKYMNIYKEMCRQFYKQFLNALLGKDQNIFGKIQIHKVQNIGSMLQEFFFSANRVGTMDIGYMFRLILQKMDEVFYSGSSLKIANLLFLVQQIAEQNFYDRSIIYETTSEEDLVTLGSIIHKCFEFIDCYKNSNISQKIVDIAILMFFEKILSQCLGDINNSEESIKISSNTYRIINSFKVIPTSDQNFLLFCFNQIANNLAKQDFQIVEYVLDILYSMLLKLKWAIKREVFIQSQISKQILLKTVELSKNSLQSTLALLRQRRKLFKIITILSFDDVLDSYRSNIDFVIQAIALDYNSQKYAKIVFDIAGISQNIDTQIIYKYFLSKLDLTIGIQNLIKALYQSFGSDMGMLEDVIYFNRTLLSDKALRMSNKQLSVLIYQIIDYSLPFINMILSSAQNESFSQVLRETYLFTNTILECNHINLYLIKRKSKNNFFEFLYQLMQSILQTYAWAEYYPELMKQTFEAMRICLGNCSDLILTWEEEEPVRTQVLGSLIRLSQCVLYFCQKLLEQSSEGFKDKTVCEKLLQSVSKLYSLMRYKRNYVYKKKLVENIGRICNENFIPANNFLIFLFKVSMSNIKNFSSILNEISLTIMNLGYFYSNFYQAMFVSLGISTEQAKKFKKLFQKIEQGQDDSLFTINLREWLSKSEKIDESEIDY